MSDIKVKVKRMKLTDLKPSEYNPRRISDEAFEGLGGSIERFGMLSHIVWNKRTGNIVGGHQRYKHLLAKGETETDVVVVDLDDNEEVALNITLNNSEVRGDFTREVMEQLRLTEAQMGSAFKKIGLLDLFEHLKGRGFDKPPREKKQRTDMSASDGGHDGGQTSTDEPDHADSNGKSKIVIVCPKCRSQWSMKDNEVVFNAVTGIGDPIGGKANADQKVEN